MRSLLQGWSFIVWDLSAAALPMQSHRAGAGGSVAWHCSLVSLAAAFVEMPGYSGHIAGGELGWTAPAHAIRLRVFSDIFLRLIKTIVAPLILGYSDHGIAAHGADAQLWEEWAETLIYFEVSPPSRCWWDWRPSTSRTLGRVGRSPAAHNE